MDELPGKFNGFWGLSTAIRKMPNGKVVAVMDADECGIVTGDECDTQAKALASVLRKAAEMFDEI